MLQNLLTLPHCRLAPNSASVAGLLHVRKLPSLGTLAPSQPEVSLYLIRCAASAKSWTCTLGWRVQGRPLQGPAYELSQRC